MQKLLPTRRRLIGGALAAPLAAMPLRAALAATPDLKPLIGNAQPISADERHARIAKLQAAMAERKIGALIVEAGSYLRVNLVAIRRQTFCRGICKRRA